MVFVPSPIPQNFKTPCLVCQWLIELIEYLLYTSSSVINQKDALRKLPGIGYNSTHSVPAVSPRSHKAGKVTASSVKAGGLRRMEHKDGREVSRVYSQPNERLVSRQYIMLSFALFFPNIILMTVLQSLMIVQTYCSCNSGHPFWWTNCAYNLQGFDLSILHI